MYIVLAGEEGGPKSNKMGGIWEVIEAEASTLASLIAAGEIPEDTNILIMGPYYPRIGTDWNAGLNRVTDTGGLETLNLEEKLAKVKAGLEKRGIRMETAARHVDGVRIGYVLFDSSQCPCDAIKKEAYELVGLDSLSYEKTWYGREYSHYLALSYCISEFVKILSSHAKVSLHCHEFGVFYAGARLDRLRVPVKTVATLHATKVGRMYGSDALEKISKNDAAWHPNTPKGLAELEALARYFNAATFVSDATRAEARLFYNIDGTVVRNGINVASDKIDWSKKEICRKKIQDFLAKNIYECYDGKKIDPENILPVFTISRLEIENKGYPDLLKALAVYDRIMHTHIRNGKIPKETRVICFLITAHGPKEKERLPRGFPVYLPEEILIGDELRLKNMIYEHELHLKNLISGRRITSAVLYPQWVSKNDGGLNMSIDEIAAGCIAAIFPSRYDPFLLTGLEAGKEGTPVIVSRVCGFSDAVHEYKVKEGVVGGVTVVDNIKLPYLEIIADYAIGLESVTKAYIRDRSKYDMMCFDAFHLAEDMSWKEPVKKYYEILSA